MLSKRCELMSFYGWSEHFVLYELTGARGWAYAAFAVENRASMLGGGVKRSTDGYVAAEIKKRLKK